MNIDFVCRLRFNYMIRKEFIKFLVINTPLFHIACVSKVLMT